MSFCSASATCYHPASPASAAGSKADEVGPEGASGFIFDEDVVEELRPILAERAARGEVKFGKEKVEMRSLTTGTGAEWVW